MKITLFFLLFYLTGYSQTDNILQKLESKHQKCLDKGEFVLDCSDIFYHEMDSLLNLHYNQLRSVSNSLQKANLKDEQLTWLEKRDKFFIENKRKIKKEAKKHGYDGGQIEQMDIVQQNAKFVKSRVVELAKKKPENYSPSSYKVNPNGYYSLDKRHKTKNEETYGYFGDILIRPISKNKVEVKLFICKGYPSYNSGTLTATLHIIDNMAIYKNSEIDSTCKIIFKFYRRGIEIDEITDDYNFGCGFGHAVVANGFFKKKSNKIPTKEEMKD